MNRDAMIAKVLEGKRRLVDAGKPPTLLAMSKIDMLKMRCTHLHGLELVRDATLKHGQVRFLLWDEQGHLKPVKP